MTLLAVQGLTVRIAGQAILRDVSFTVSEGEVLALYGPSGAGKSTALHAVCGLLEPVFEVSGSIRFHGRDVTSLLPEARSHAGMSILLQGLHLFPHLSVAGNVAYPLERRGVGRSEAVARAAEKLEAVGLAGMGERSPSSLSGGQRQRVALARAMIYEPSLILLDEPLKGLQQGLRDSFLAEVRGLAQAGTAVILVTHEVREIQLAADRVVTIADGRVSGIESRADDGRPFTSTTPDVHLPTAVRRDGPTVKGHRVRLLPNPHAHEPRDFAEGRIIELRHLPREGAAVLIRYASGELGWVDIANGDSQGLQTGQRVGVAVNLEDTEGGS